MYSDMLNAAVKALRSGEEPDLESPFNAQCEVNLHAPALLPSDYCPDVHARLGFYKKLSHARDADDLIQTQEALIDRYGKLPEAAQTLLATHRLRLMAEPLGVLKIDAHENSVTVQFSAKPAIDPLRIIQLVQERRDIKLAGQDKLKMELKDGANLTKRVESVRGLLKALGGN